MAWRAGGGTNSARAARQRPWELGRRRAGGSVGSTSGRTSSRGVRGRTECAQARLGLAEHQARRGVPMAGGGGLGVARGEEAVAFKAGREAVRLLPSVPR
jgi:hypothetical protein